MHRLHLKNMVKNQYISHKGIVTKLLANGIEVSINSQSACAGCHAKGACGISSETKKKIITITTDSHDYHLGDSVTVIGKLSDGFFSIFLVYVIPTLLILITLFTMNYLSIDELTMAITSLGTVMIYYFIVYLLRTRIGKNIKFIIEKI